MPRSTPATKVVLITLLPIVLVLGIWLGAHPRWLPDPIADVIVGNEDRRVALEALDRIHERYYRPVEYGDLSDSAIGGAVKDLEDRFSSYFTANDYKEFQQALDNEFEGIGVAVTKVEAGLRIGKVYDDAPAERAGIREGDVITHVNGRPIANLDEDASTTIIKGPEGTKVMLRLRRGKRSFERRVTRAAIMVPVVESRIANAGGERAAHRACRDGGCDPAPQAAQGEGHRVRPARQRRRARQRGAADREHVPARGADRHDEGSRRGDAHAVHEGPADRR